MRVDDHQGLVFLDEMAQQAHEHRVLQHIRMVAGVEAVAIAQHGGGMIPCAGAPLNDAQYICQHPRRQLQASREAARASAVAVEPVSTSRTSGATTLYLAFSLSGLTGLIYEATWSRYLQLFLGHAAYAQVLVLALFMAGMAAGALIVSRLSATRVRPLVAYAIVEAILGAAAFAFHPLFDVIRVRGGAAGSG